MSAMLPPSIAIKRIEQTRFVNCGIVHEKRDPKFSAIECPIRHSGNTACCHQELNTSISFAILDAINTVVQMQDSTSETLIAPRRIQEMKEELQKITMEFLRVDRLAREYYETRQATPKRIQQKFGPNQLRLGHKINTIRLEVLAALQLLQEVS